MCWGGRKEEKMPGENKSPLVPQVSTQLENEAETCRNVQRWRRMWSLQAMRSDRL